MSHVGMEEVVDNKSRKARPLQIVHVNGIVHVQWVRMRGHTDFVGISCMHVAVNIARMSKLVECLLT